MNKEEQLQDIENTLEQMLTRMNVKKHKSGKYLTLFFRMFILHDKNPDIKANQYKKTQKVNKNITNKLNLLRELLKPVDRLNEKE